MFKKLFFSLAFAAMWGCSSGNSPTPTATESPSDPVESFAVMAADEYFNKGEIAKATDSMPIEKQMELMGPLGGPEGARNAAQADMFFVQKRCKALTVTSRGKEQISGNVWIVKLALDGECEELKARSNCSAMIDRGGFAHRWKGKANEFPLAVAQTSDGDYYTTVQDLKGMASGLGGSFALPFKCPATEVPKTPAVEEAKTDAPDGTSSNNESQTAGTADAVSEPTYEEMLQQCMKQKMLEQEAAGLETNENMREVLENECHSALEE
jgi:hypothetical protein